MPHKLTSFNFGGTLTTEVPMARKPNRWRVSGAFRFTGEELAEMRRRMELTMQIVEAQAGRSQSPEARRYNRGVIRKGVAAVRNAEASPEVPARVLHAVYRTAWTAYRAALALGRSESEARRSAAIHAQDPLERHMDILPATDWVMASDDDTLSRMAQRWLRKEKPPR